MLGVELELGSFAEFWIFGGLAFGEKPYLDLWQKLPPDPVDPEVQRNIAITQPCLWLE